MKFDVRITKDSASKLFRDFPRMMKRINRLALTNIARDGQQLVQSHAPVKSGRLKAGVVGSIINNDRAKIVSSVPTSYPYNLWANREPGYELLPQSQMVAPFFRPGQKPFRYGDTSAVSASGKSIKWSRSPGFMDIAFRAMDSVVVGNYERAFNEILR